MSGDDGVVVCGVVVVMFEGEGERNFIVFLG